MTTETAEQIHVVTDLPNKKSRLRNPFIKKDTVPSDAENTTPTKGKVLHGVYTAGVLLLVAGAVVAVASKLGKTDDEADNDSDIETTDN